MNPRPTMLELTADELALLAELIEHDYRELKEEIGKTEGFRFKEELRAREAVLRGLLEKVSGGPPAA